MKESKNFFDNNRLNKGHSKSSNLKQSDASIIRKKYQHMLPPIEMIEHYEELHPGTLEKLLAMTQREQNHRHSIDLMAMEKHNKATQLGRVFSLVFIALVSITSLVLCTVDSLAASIFAFSAFASITIVSYFYSKNSLKKESTRSRNIKPRNYRSSYKKPSQSR